MIGIITALEKEYVAMSVMLDDANDHTIPGDGAGRRYLRGTIPAASGGRHTVYLALATDMGNNASAIRTSQMLQHFPAMKHVLMVAIAGGVPNPAKAEDHVRLGDVVVSDRGGVVQYDLGKEEFDYVDKRPKFTSRFPPRPPSAELLEAVRLLRASELRGDRTWLKYLDRAARLPNSARPADDADKLYDTYQPDRLMEHPIDLQRIPGQPRVFLGIIGSSDSLQRNPVLRDELRRQHGIKAIEMEGAGVADAAWQLECGYLVIRGVCDYCDSHKNDVWQEYAAAVAAAYARGLLATLPAEVESAMKDTDRSAKTVFDMRGQQVEKQININGNYIEDNIRDDGNIMGDHSRSTVIKNNSIAPLDPKVQRALAEIQRHLRQADQRDTRELVDIVREWRERDADAFIELCGMVDGLRHTLINLQSCDLPKMDQDLRDAIAEVTEVVKSEADGGTGLELSIPLVPLLLNYKVNLDLGSGLDLRQWWEKIREKLMRGA
ncbi:5'-methylthioadenosine/S-adenosylhomocysteine nucleosidase [Thermoflexales bacterium]|nr:5'-methylthioadenosine/S-adenosylhomocysteine nucleosidase [Thermoflexales bacterium]